MVVLFENNPSGKQPVSDGENEITSPQRAVRSVAFTKKSSAPTDCPHPFDKKSQPTEVPLLSVRSKLLYTLRSSAQSTSVRMDARS